MDNHTYDLASVLAEKGEGQEVYDNQKTFDVALFIISGREECFRTVNAVGRGPHLYSSCIW